MSPWLPYTPTFFMGNAPKPKFQIGDRVQHISKPKLMGIVQGLPGSSAIYIRLDSGNDTTNFQFYKVVGTQAAPPVKMPASSDKLAALRDLLRGGETKKGRPASIAKKKVEPEPYYPKPACECGAHSCGYNTHSSWCKLFSK